MTLGLAAAGVVGVVVVVAGVAGVVVVVEMVVIAAAAGGQVAEASSRADALRLAVRAACRSYRRRRLQGPDLPRRLRRRGRPRHPARVAAAALRRSA
jgi:hypothetical protein